MCSVHDLETVSRNTYNHNIVVPNKEQDSRPLAIIPCHKNSLHVHEQDISHIRKLKHVLSHLIA